MAKIKWKTKKEKEEVKLIAEQQKVKKEQFKGKKFGTLSTKEKDTLLEILAKEHNLI